MKWVSFLVFFLCVVSVGEAGETMVVNVSLNTVDQGEFVLIRTSDQKILFPQDSFQTLGFSAIPIEARVVYENTDYVSLSALKQVWTNLDTGKARLLIVADPRLLQKQVKDLSETKQERAPQLQRIPSAFLNYNIRYDLDNPSRDASISLPLELGLSAGELFGLSTFSYRHTTTDTAFQRISSRVTWDDISASRQFVVGDISASSGGLGGGGALGGVSVFKNFSIQGGYFSPYAPLHFAGMLDIPSDVTLLINGLTVAKEHFGPGPFEFANVPASAGAGEGWVIIRDAFGRETGIPLSYYYVSSLLKPGLTEYGYQIGAKRKGDNTYKEMAAVGFHRIGVTNSLTLGFRAEADQLAGVAP